MVGILQGTQGREADLSQRTAQHIIVQCKHIPGFNFYPLTVDDLVRKTSQPDVIINIHYGFLGDGGSVPGLLSLLNINYTGSGVLASAMGRDKVMTKIVGRSVGINFPDHIIIDPSDKKTSKESVLSRFRLPIILKPIDSASSIDVILVQTETDLDSALQSLECYTEIMVEPFIKGKEITVCVLEKAGNPVPLPIIGIDIKRQPFQNYTAKYGDGEMEFLIPANIDEQTAERARRIAVKLHEAVGCRGYSRSDMIIGESGEITVLEINTFPGIGPFSEFPKAARISGIEYPEMILALIQTALKP